MGSHDPPRVVEDREAYVVAYGGSPARTRSMRSALYSSAIYPLARHWCHRNLGGRRLPGSRGARALHRDSAGRQQRACAATDPVVARSAGLPASPRCYRMPRGPGTTTCRGIPERLRRAIGPSRKPAAHDPLRLSTTSATAVSTRRRKRWVLCSRFPTRFRVEGVFHWVFSF